MSPERAFVRGWNTVALAMAFASCSGSQRPLERPLAREVYKFTLEGARACCDVVQGPAGDLVSVSVQGAAVPVVVARAACTLLDLALPRDIGVVVLEDGTGELIERHP